MTHLRPPESHLSIHLSDRLLTPLISSARSPINSTNTGASSSDSPSTQTPQPYAQSSALISLTSTALTAYDAALRLELGMPQRMMIETEKGPLILHSFLDTKGSEDGLEPVSMEADRNETGNGDGDVTEKEDVRLLGRRAERGSYLQERDRPGLGVSEGPTHSARDSGYDRRFEAEIEREEGTRKKHAPLLLATVVAGRAEALGDARRAAGKLETMGRRFQREWIREEEDGDGNGVER